jgi:uncharacterized protein YjeT (DUF2065 family)
MSKIILFGFVAILAGIFLFSAPSAYAEEIPASPVSAKEISAPLTQEEIVILQQSLAALTAVLTNLQATLAKSNDLPQNTAQIIASLSDIGKSLAQISATMEKRGLAVAAPKVTISQAPLVTIQSSEAVESSDEEVISESIFAESEGQLETLLEGSGAETESNRTLMASISAIAGQKITWVVVVLLAIGAVLFWKMRGGQEVVKA